MKNIFKFWGIVALAAVIGFSMTACGGDDDDNNDVITESFSGTFTFDQESGVITFSEDMYLSGNYNSGDDTITVQDTEPEGGAEFINGTYSRIGTGSGLSGSFGKTFDFYDEWENKNFEITVTITFSSDDNVTVSVRAKEKSSSSNNNNNDLSGNYVSDKNSNEYLAFTGSTVAWFIDTDKMFEGSFTVSSNTVNINITWLAQGVEEETPLSVGGTQFLRINTDNSLSFIWGGEVDSEKWIK